MTAGDRRDADVEALRPWPCCPHCADDSLHTVDLVNEHEIPCDICVMDRLADKRLADLLAQARREGAVAALNEAADTLSDRLDQFPQQGRHTRARWAEQWLRDRAQQIGGAS